MRDIDNAVIITAKVKSGETIATGDIVYFGSDGLTKTVGTNKTFGVVIDEDNEAANRMVLVQGIVEFPLTTGTWYDGNPFYFSTATGKAVSGLADDQQINGVYTRGKVYLSSNVVYTKT